MKIIANSNKETLSFAKSFAKSLKNSEVIGLIGELGAGKTAFTQGLAKGLRVNSKVNSPTFVVMKVYKTKESSKVKSLVHIDAYRLKSYKDLEAIGALEYFNRPHTVVVIEWADKIKKILPPRARILKFKILNNDRREITY